MNKMKLFKEIAPEICHAMWCSYQMGCGQDYNLLPDENDLASRRDAIDAFIKNPELTPSDNHDNWMAYRLSQGWVYGEVKDKEKKTHPDLVPFGDLPTVEQGKDTADLEARKFAWNIAGKIVQNFTGENEDE